MPEPATASTTAALAITGAGLSVFGLATGMHPEFLVAGCTGALWALSYQEPQPLLRRATVTTMSALLAAYLTPLSVAVLQIGNWLPGAVELDLLQMPVALFIGFIAHRKLGPAINKTADLLLEQAPKK